MQNIKNMLKQEKHKRMNQSIVKRNKIARITCASTEQKLETPKRNVLSHARPTIIDGMPARNLEL